MTRPVLRIYAVNVFVRDQDASLRFYIDQLGFELAFDARLQSGDRWVGVAPPDGSAILTLIAPKPDSKACKLIGTPTGVTLVTEDVIATYNQWQRRKVRFLFAPRLRRLSYRRTGDQPVWGGVFTRFLDLDGNSFSLVGLDDVNRELEQQRRQAAEKLEAERRAAQELEIAKQVQSRLFPQRHPPIASLEYDGVCIQARQVGGDYYDFLDLGSGRFGLVIGDISGKGIAAALLMANLQANLRSQCAIALDDPARALQSVNQLFCENSTESAYATLLYAHYDDDTRRLRYVNCGHLAGLVLRGGGEVERLGSTATVIGIFQEWECAVEELVLHAGDLLALYTDGVTESFDESGEDFGERRLIEVLRRNRHLAAGGIVAAVVAAVRQFSPSEQHDDITVIVAKCR